MQRAIFTVVTTSNYYKALKSVTKTGVINDVCDAKFQLNLFRTFSFSVIDDDGHKQTFHICYTSLNICIVLVLYLKTVQFYSSKINRSTKQYTSGNFVREFKSCRSVSWTSLPILYVLVAHTISSLHISHLTSISMLIH